MALALPADLSLKLNLAAVYAHVANQSARVAGSLPDAWGFMGRLALGWTFR